MSVLVARTINVNISGEVFNYGNFNVSALNNAFNVLVAGGGPSDIGTVRNIQLKRSGQSPKTLDIYKYIQDPIVGDNFFLQENDYIYVPVAKKLVTVYGAVNRSYKYELLPNETLSDLINYAGGLKSNALSRNIQIERRVGDKLEIIDVDFDLSSSKNIALQNGDKIFVQTVDSELEKVVTISGAVEVSGVFALTDNMTLVDLANKAKLKENAINYNNSMDPLTWIFDLLRAAGSQALDLQQFGIASLKSYDPTTIKDVINKELLELSEAHHERYFKKL